MSAGRDIAQRVTGALANTLADPVREPGAEDDEGSARHGKKGLVGRQGCIRAWIRGFRCVPILSEITPKNLGDGRRRFAITVDQPTKATLAPRVPVGTGASSEWIISDEMSMNRLTRPSAHTVGGMLTSQAPEEAKRGLHCPTLAAPTGDPQRNCAGL